MTTRDKLCIALLAWALAWTDVVLQAQDAPPTPVAVEEESVPEDSRAPSPEAPVQVPPELEAVPTEADTASNEPETVAPVTLEEEAPAPTVESPVSPEAPTAVEAPVPESPEPVVAEPVVAEPVVETPVTPPEPVEPVAADPVAPDPHTVEIPVPAPAGEEKPAEETESAAEPRKGAVGSGIKSVWNILAGDNPEAAVDPLEKGTNDETLKKVNELIRLANTSIEKGRVAEAIRNVNELITLKPYDADFHLALGLCYRSEKKYKDALKKYQDVLDLGGPKALVAVLKAESYAAEGNKEKAFEFLKEAAVGGRNIVNDVSNLPLLVPYQGDTEFIKLALALEKFEVAAGRTHDPFTNPFPRPDAAEPGEGQEAPGVVTLTPEEQEKLLHDAKKTYERVLFYIKLEDEGKAMKAYAQLREFTKKRDLLTIPKIVNEFRVLLGRLEEVEVQIEGIRLKYYYNQAQTKLALVKEAFTDGEYTRVETIHGEIIGLTKEMEQTNARYKPVADQILAVSTRWLERAQIRMEFQNRKPNIQGIIISEAAKMAVLNDRVIKQGEAVEDFRVVKVESNKVTFRYKGEEIPLVFRRY